MKKIIVLILVVVLIGGFYYWWSQRPTSTTATDSNTQATGSLQPDPSNATFTIEGETITLSDGRNENPLPGSAIVEETVLMEEFAYGDLNNDGKQDTALLLARYGGGSGTFVYAAAYISGPVNYKGTDAVFIGDRIIPQSISVSGGVVTVKYLDREPEAAFTDAPTVESFKQFVLRSGEFVER